MLDTELELAQLRQVLKVLRLANASIAIPNGLHETLKHTVIKLTVALITEVASSLMKVLGDPEGTIGDINIDGQTGARAAGGWLGLRRSQQMQKSTSAIH
jgi:hypothetical protein